MAPPRDRYVTGLISGYVLGLWTGFKLATLLITTTFKLIIHLIES